MHDKRFLFFHTHPNQQIENLPKQNRCIVIQIDFELLAGNNLFYDCVQIDKNKEGTSVTISVIFAELSTWYIFPYLAVQQHSYLC